MKTHLTGALATALLFFSYLGNSQTTFSYADKADAILQNVTKSYMNTDVLFDRAFPASRFDGFDPFSDTVDYEYISQVYHELYQASYDRTKFIDPTTMNNMVEWENIRGRVPIMVLDYRYNQLDPHSVQNGLLNYSNGQFHDVPGRSIHPFLSKRIQLAAPLTQKVKSTQVTFVILPHFISRNTGLDVQQVKLELPFQTYFLNGPLDSVTVSFSSADIISFYITVNLSDGSQIRNLCSIAVGGANHAARVNNEAPPPCRAEFIQSDYAWQGYDESQPYKGMFEVNYYFRTNDGTECNGLAQSIKRPVILIDGFDPTDKRTAQRLYDEFLYYIDDVTFPSQTERVDIVREMRALGYDVIIVNITTYFHTSGGQIIPLPTNANTPPPGYTYTMGKLIRGGGDYVERNARTLATLINQINANLAAQGSTEKLVIVGPSMGGQISRYALKWMENNGMDHNCRLWVSNDSNHEGAVLPIGEQFVIDAMASMLNGADIARERQLNCPAAKQFLIDHYLYHKQTGDLNAGGAPGFFNQYYQMMDNLGWPQNVRKIAMISGAENGTPLNTPQAGELAMNMNAALGRSGLLFSWWCDFTNSNCRLFDVSMFTAPAPGNTGKVAEITIPLLFDYKKTWNVAGSPLTRGHSLEAVQSGFYWGYKELGDIGNSMPLPRKVRRAIQLNIPAGYHAHQPTASTLAFRKGPNPSAFNFKWDDDVTPYNLACEGYIPFDYYYGPTTFNVKHDSLFYYQAKILLEEIQGITHHNRKPRTVEVESTDMNGLWCPNDTKRFFVPNAPGAGFTWEVSNPALQIVSGQGSHEIFVRYNQTSYPYQPLVVKVGGSGSCYDYSGSARYQGAGLVDPDMAVGKFRYNGITEDLMLNEVNTVYDATTATVTFGSSSGSAMVGMQNLSYT